MTLEHRSNAEVLFEEGFQLVNDCLLLGCSSRSTKARHWGHDLIDVRARGLHLAVTECRVDIVTGFLWLQALVRNDLGQFFLPLALRFRAGGFLGQPGYIVADALGAASGGLIWWVLMVVNSLVWGAVLSLFVFPFIRKVLK